MTAHHQNQSNSKHSLFMSKRPHFFKVILEEAIRDGKLGIPRNFVRKYGKRLRSPVQLEVPSGAIWQIELTKGDERVWLQRGWQEFAEHYSLKVGYFVVFRYEGIAHFRVLIFDKSASEIEYPYASTEEHDDAEDDMSVELCDDVSESWKSKKKSHLPCPRPRKKMRTDSPHPGTDLKFEILSSRSSFNDLKSRKMKLENLKKVEKSRCSRGQPDGITGARNVKTKALNCVRRLSSTEMAHAIQRASASKTENPAFVMVIPPSFGWYKHRMNIPANFARKYFTRQNGNLTLCDSTGKTWSAKYSLSANINKPNPRIQCGWRAFAEDHNLNVGDVCVFELIKHPDILLKVVIYPDVENANKACRLRTDGSIASQARIRSLGSDTEPNHRQSRCQSSSKEFKDLNIEENVKKMEPLILTEKKRASIRASAFKYANPSFTVLMQPSYINSATLYIPANFARKYFTRQNRNLTLCDSTGKTWPAKYTLSSKINKQNPRIQGGWRAFAEDHNLDVGDICVFELIKHPDILLKVIIYPVVENASKACRPLADGRAKIRSLSSDTEHNHRQSRCQSSSREFQDSNINENANLCQKTLTEKEKAFMRSSAFKSGNPSFTVRMNLSYANGATLYIPCQFSQRYLKNNSEVTLRVSDGRTWIVDYKRKASRLKSSARFRRNTLRAFVIDNNLKVGDICVFELIDENKILLEVAFFSAAEIASCSSLN